MKISPDKYAELSILAREAAEEILARLEWMTIKPDVVVDLGAGTGDMSARLQMRYPEAHVLAVDLSEAMITHAREHHPALSCVCADAYSLPFANASVNLLVANLLLPWIDDLPCLLRECRRIMHPEGLLIFTALGPDTFREWRGVFASDATPVLMDMHDAGDLLLQQRFADPVLDVNYYTMTYREQTKCFEELLATSMLTVLPDLQQGNSICEVTYEVIFGHAFMQAEKSAEEEGIVRVPLSQLRRI